MQPWDLDVKPQAAILTTEEEVVMAAELSIQRQISISQRQLLLPIMRERGRRAGARRGEAIPFVRGVEAAAEAIAGVVVDHTMKELEVGFAGSNRKE